MNKIERVSDILLRLRLEQIQPDTHDVLLLQAYVDGKISIADLLGHARQFATEAHYQEWMRDAAHLDGGCIETATEEDQFFLEVEALMRRKHLGIKI